MANNWAIAIGINQYHFFQPLACARSDAEALKSFLVSDGGFTQQKCLLMSDTSPPIGDRSTSPTKENILLLLEDLAAACWQPQDLVWFFFSGYAISKNDRDYLIPIDADPQRVEETGIEVAGIMQTLQTAGVNALILLDINRASGIQNGALVGQEIIELAQELQFPLIVSCQPEQFSYESSELGHGFFTAALLEALSSGNGNTLGELEAYLSVRTPELCQHYWRPTQNPVTVITSSKQVILGNSELENDMDAAAIVVSEEMFASAMAAPALEHKQKSNTYSHINSNNNYSQLINSPSLTSFGRQGYTNSGVKENPVREQPLPPPSLPPAKPRVEISQPISSIQSPNTGNQEVNQETNTGISYWQQVLLWGGSTAMMLLMIVFLLFRSQAGSRIEPTYSETPIANPDETSFVKTLPETPSNTESNTEPLQKPLNSPKPQPTITSALQTPQAIVKPQPQVTPTTAVPTPTATSTPTPVTADISESQNRKQALSELTKLSLSPNQASDLKFAIIQASKIKPGEVRYAQAQANIKIWNNMMLNLAHERAKKRQYNSAIAAAELINPNDVLHAQATTAINQWRQQAKQYLSNKTVVDAATALIKPGQASTYNRAIEVAKKVSKGEPGFDIAQKSIDKWSKEILNLAKTRATKGNKKAAIATASLVPEGTQGYDTAQKAIQKWKK